MSEPDVTELLDRVAAHTPPMDVEIPEVVGIGRRRRRRRRVVAGGAGMALAGVLLAGGLWWGLGEGSPLGPTEVQPASPTMSVGDELVLADGARFALGADGAEVVATGEETFRAPVDPEGGPLVSLLGEGRPVVYVPGWDPSSEEGVRVGTVGADGSTAWTEPVDVAGVVLADGTPVVAVVAEAPPQAFGEAQPDGSVREFTPGATEWEPVGEGGHVTLLGEDYEVAVDEHGWPMLLEADGSTFLTVSDGQGVSGGGTVMWRERWWPWSARNAVHFFVGWEPPAGEEVVVRGGDGDWFDPADVVTISGPEGVVTLVAIPAEDDGLDVTGLGLRTEDGVRPVSP